MSRLHLFFPENDIALIKGHPNFTPPVTARDLHIAGAVLPLWYGDPGDRVLANGVDAEWLDEVRLRFGLGTYLFDHTSIPGLTPSPWGWSAASRQVFMDEGVDSRVLPSDDTLTRMRRLAHRRTSAVLAEVLHKSMPEVFAGAAVEMHSVDEVKEFLDREPSAVLKAPYSSSGRGVLFSRFIERQTLFAQVAGIIRRQGSVMAEPERDRVADFALLYDCAGEDLNFAGLSVFSTTERGQYDGNILADDAALASMLDVQCIDEVISIVKSALAGICAVGYTGALGVDMMKCRDGRLAVSEINFRMTMGRVARILSDRYLAPGMIGRYDVTIGEITGCPAPVVRNGRLCGGCLRLNPPGCKFSFLMRVMV